MSIRQPAAEKLIRQLLDLPLYRSNILTDKFISEMAKVIQSYVRIDEQNQYDEGLIKNKEDIRGIRQPAAEKLARQILEMPIYRAKPLSDRFVLTMANMVRAHVGFDEQRQRAERLWKMISETHDRLTSDS